MAKIFLKPRRDSGVSTERYRSILVDGSQTTPVEVCYVDEDGIECSYIHPCGLFDFVFPDKRIEVVNGLNEVLISHPEGEEVKIRLNTGEEYKHLITLEKFTIKVSQGFRLRR